MAADGENGLTGRRILVPPARPEANPLLHILQKHGAEVIEFPKLITAPPVDYGAMDESIRNLKQFDWIIFSGSNCVVNFFERLDELAGYRAEFSGRRIAAIGYGAVSA
ncbi:MAG: uroporphyrinogen-III synthase, partial [Thermodesulfovibrionia bacterium]|nr:uroporphyrinogen-III synthase [Thermodesulfovibrionia bacterium]